MRLLAAASKIDDLKSGSLRGADLRAADTVETAPSPSISNSNKAVSSSSTQPIATFDEGQKKVVFSQKLRTKEYETHSHL